MLRMIRLETALAPRHLRRTGFHKRELTDEPVAVVAKVHQRVGAALIGTACHIVKH